MRKKPPRLPITTIHNKKLRKALERELIPALEKKLGTTLIKVEAYP